MCIRDRSKVSDCYILAFPNAGLPNAFGEYDQTPEDMAGLLEEWVAAGLINILGGCCGTTPDHIASMADRADKALDGAPRKAPEIEPTLRLSGLEPFALG